MLLRICIKTIWYLLKILMIVYQTAGIIHENIKPVNVLAFEDNSWFVAKVVDFGFAICFQSRNDLISMLKSEPWNAFERHNRHIKAEQVKQMDVYSFDMLCLWLVFGAESFVDLSLSSYISVEMGKFVSFDHQRYMRKSNRFSAYCQQLHNRLKNHEFKRSFKLNKDPNQQNNLKTWVEFFNFEYWQYDKSANVINRRQSQHDEVWKKLVDSKILESFETEKLLWDFAYAMQLRGEENQVQKTANSVISIVNLADQALRKAQCDDLFKQFFVQIEQKLFIVKSKLATATKFFENINIRRKFIFEFKIQTKSYNIAQTMQVNKAYYCDEYCSNSLWSNSSWIQLKWLKTTRLNEMTNFNEISNIIASTITIKNQRQNDKNKTTKTSCCQKINHKLSLFQRHFLLNSQSNQIDFTLIQIF